jgi:hypothetical protein
MIAGLLTQQVSLHCCVLALVLTISLILQYDIHHCTVLYVAMHAVGRSVGAAVLVIALHRIGRAVVGAAAAPVAFERDVQAEGIASSRD